MRKNLLFLLFAISSQAAISQTTVIRNPEIAQMVSEISSDSLEHHVRTLASFNSRHTLSANQENGMPAAIWRKDDCRNREIHHPC